VKEAGNRDRAKRKADKFSTKTRKQKITQVNLVSFKQQRHTNAKWPPRNEKKRGGGKEKKYDSKKATRQEGAQNERGNFVWLPDKENRKKKKCSPSRQKGSNTLVGNDGIKKARWS